MAVKMNLEKELGKAVGEIIESKLRDEEKEKHSMFKALANGRRQGVRVITELKLSSPSKGELKTIQKEDIPGIVHEFERGGASAISVLIEPRRFNGSIENLKIVRGCTNLPVLAKGFVFTPLHLAECAAAGADAYLLMVRVLDAVGQDLAEFVSFGNALGMEAFIEANCAEEIERSLALNPKIIEINNRNIYEDLSLDLGNSAMGKKLPADLAFVSASGVESAEDIKRVYELSGRRADAVLVGTSIMQSENIAEKVRELVDAGKEVVK